MTENEAIKELETSIDLAKMCTQNYERKSEIQGYEMAIKALEEVQQYRQVGKIGTCRNAVEICKAMIERGIDLDNVIEYIKFEDNLMQRGYDPKRLLEMMEKHKQYQEIGTVEECLRYKDFLDFLSDKMNPNDFETYLSMYNSSGEKVGEDDGN